MEGDVYFAVVDTAVSGDNTIVTASASPSAAPGKNIRVLGYNLVSAGAVLTRWKDSAPTNLSGAMTQNSGVPNARDNERGVFQTSQGKDLILNLSGAVQVSGHITYTLIG